MNPRTLCACKPIWSIISDSVAQPLCWSMATTWAVLLPSRGAPDSRFAGLGALVRGVLGAFSAVTTLLNIMVDPAAPMAVKARRLPHSGSDQKGDRDGGDRSARDGAGARGHKNPKGCERLPMKAALLKRLKHLEEVQATENLPPVSRSASSRDFQLSAPVTAT